MRSFVKIKSSRNGEIILSFTDTGKSCLCRDCLTSQICLLTLFAKIRFSRKFRNTVVELISDSPEGHDMVHVNVCLCQYNSE